MIKLAYKENKHTEYNYNGLRIQRKDGACQRHQKIIKYVNKTFKDENYNI